MLTTGCRAGRVGHGPTGQKSPRVDTRGTNIELSLSVVRQQNSRSPLNCGTNETRLTTSSVPASLQTKPLRINIEKQPGFLQYQAAMDSLFGEPGNTSGTQSPGLTRALAYGETTTALSGGETRNDASDSDEFSKSLQIIIGVLVGIPCFFVFCCLFCSVKSALCRRLKPERSNEATRKYKNSAAPGRSTGPCTGAPKT
ncbi:hypothetical protein LSAT2_026278 [Lamellibrachia satsuma]|nr:hypothetical protein LSAT2_026278 [Lamellibrachia satsuma]